MKYNIRKATNKDEKRINDLIIKYLGPIGHVTYNKKEITYKDIYKFNAKIISEIIDDFYIAVDEYEEIIGVCAISDNGYPDDFYDIGVREYKIVATIIIDKEFRGKGIGSKLLENAIKENRNNIIVCEAWGYNGKYAHADKILRQNGFKLVKNMGKNYYKDRGDCVSCVNRNNCDVNLCTTDIYLRDKM